MTDDETGSKRHRNSVFDCNWQSKMQFLRLIDLSSSTVTSTLIAAYPGRRQSKTTVAEDERESIRLRNSASWNRKTLFVRLIVSCSSITVAVFDCRLIVVTNTIMKYTLE